MSSANSFRRSKDDWWESLGLEGPLDPVGRAGEQVLRKYRPVGFRSAGSNKVRSLDQVAGLIARAEQEAELQRERARAERRAADVAEFEAAFALPDGDVVVRQGRWAGFTRSEATAWCWNLFQYEPHGWVPPGIQVRAEALVKLRAGILPEVFGYPERAQELAAKGITARQYREHREALGSPMFDPADVRYG